MALRYSSLNWIGSSFKTSQKGVVASVTTNWYSPLEASRSINVPVPLLRGMHLDTNGKQKVDNEGEEKPISVTMTKKSHRVVVDNSTKSLE